MTEEEIKLTLTLHQNILDAHEELTKIDDDKYLKGKVFDLIEKYMEAAYKIGVADGEKYQRMSNAIANSKVH